MVVDFHLFLVSLFHPSFCNCSFYLNVYCTLYSSAHVVLTEKMLNAIVISAINVVLGISLTVSFLHTF